MKPPPQPSPGPSPCPLHTGIRRGTLVAVALLLIARSAVAAAPAPATDAGPSRAPAALAAPPVAPRSNATNPPPPGIPSSLASPSPRTWTIGQIVEADIVTPEPLTVFNPEQTEALRQAELPRIAPVFRYDAAVTRLAEAELRQHFAAAREGFLALIASGFQQRPLRAVSDLSDPRFFEAIRAFRSRQAGFPLSTNLAELWALGDAGGVVLEDLAGRLRRCMGSYLRADRLPDGEKLNVSAIRIVPVDATNATTLRGTTIPRAGIYSLSRYRRELAAVTPEIDRPFLGYVAGFLRPNCTFDPDATAQARDRRIQAINAVDQYAAGAILARRGQVIDARTRHALNALEARQQARLAEQSAARLGQDLERAKAQAGAFRTAAELEQQRATAAATAFMAVSQDAAAIEQRNRRLLWGLGGASAACGLFAALWWRHRARQRRLEQSIDWSVVRAGGPASEAELWRERALAAEARAEKATSVLRTQLLPHLARWMMTELMQRLLSQRSAAQSTQQRAELEVSELAARLEKLHAPLEDRLRAYERRIAELEADLAVRDAQNLELIQARIESTRRQLETERAAGAPWN